MAGQEEQEEAIQTDRQFKRGGGRGGMAGQGKEEDDIRTDRPLKRHTDDKRATKHPSHPYLTLQDTPRPSLRRHLPPQRPSPHAPRAAPAPARRAPAWCLKRPTAAQGRSPRSCTASGGAGRGEECRRHGRVGGRACAGRNSRATARREADGRALSSSPADPLCTARQVCHPSGLDPARLRRRWVQTA